jgi:hypothetical protein
MTEHSLESDPRHERCDTSFRATIGYLIPMLIGTSAQAESPTLGPASGQDLTVAFPVTVKIVPLLSVMVVVTVSWPADA